MEEVTTLAWMLSVFKMQTNKEGNLTAEEDNQMITICTANVFFKLHTASGNQLESTILSDDDRRSVEMFFRFLT